MSKVAPPLGNLTREQSTQTTPAKLPTPKVAPPKELVFSAPGVSNTLPVNRSIPQSMDFSKVEGPAGDAIASDAVRRNESVPLPIMQTLDSTPDMPVSDVFIKQLAGDESTPFDYTPVGAGNVGTDGIITKPVAGVAKYNSQVGQPFSDPLANIEGSKIILANSRPVNQYQYTEGLTQSQRNSRNFFNGLQEFRQQLQPVQLPAIQFTPQQLNPGVAGGFSPTAETKGPLSWLVDGQQEDFNPFKLEFGGQGGGILGGAGWLFSRLSPLTYIQGAALDVSRSAAAIYEGGSSGLTELFKSGDFGKAWNSTVDAMSQNYYANSPEARGLTAKTIFGSKDAGEFFSSSYFLTAASGMADYSFSSTGNNPLLTGDASYGVVNKGDNFNPFGLRDPIRSGFNTGALEAKEREQANAAWNANPYRALPGNPLHGYDQWIRGGVGLVGDILGGNIVDAAVLKSLTKAGVLGKTAGKTANVFVKNQDEFDRGIAALRSPANNPARYIPDPPGALVRVATEIPTRQTPDITQFIDKVTPAKSGKLARVTPSERGITQVVEGEFVESASDIIVRRRREYRDPIVNRYLPQGGDPFSVSSSRAYVPEAGINGVSFESGGALIPYTGKNSDIVPAVLGVGGKPGGVPVTPRAEAGRTFLAGSSDVPSVTVWDDATQSFVNSGKPSKGVQEVPVYGAPGNVPKVKETPLPEPPRGLSEDVIDGTVVDTPLLPPYSSKKPDVPTLDNPTLVTPTASKGGRPGFVDRMNRVSSDTPAKPGINSRTIYKAGKALDELPDLVPRNTPNFTVKPTVPDSVIREAHTVDDVTGVFTDSAELAGVTQRKVDALTSPANNELPTPVPVPVKQVEYITAEAISPSVSSADIVRRLTSGEDIPGAVYNPRQVERQSRSLQSVVSLARQVTLPNGVRIIDELTKDTSVMKWDRIAKKVETAIVASGLNPGSSEAQSIRRLFDRFGKPLPENLSPDFAIEVAGRSVTSPASYVKPATQVVEGNVTWTGRAARYSPTYEMSGDYAIGVKVKYDEDLKRIVPVDGQDMKLSPAVRTEAITRSTLRDLPVPDRQNIVSKSFKDGYEVPPQAVEDVLNPDILTDTMAAKSYAQANIPKDSIPLRMDREARQVLSEHSDLVREAAYTRDAITDVSTQLTDVERQLNQYLKQVDELPDIGVEALVDDVPFSPLPKLNTEDLPPVTGQSKVISEGQLYHGTRVQDLVLNGVDPLQGAARSEYGTGVWLTKSQEVATAAAGRSIPANSVPNVTRTFGDSAYIHELPGSTLDNMNIPRATDVPPAKVVNGLLEQLDSNRFVFSDVVPYGDDLTDELVNLLESGKVQSYSDLFSKVDDLTHKTAKRNLGTKPDEYELTYVQRVVTDMLKGTGVQGLTNDVNTVIYDTRMLTAKYVHDVTDIVGDSSSEVTTALHNVNLLQKSLDAEPTSQLLRVQLAEAKAVAASKIRDSLSDELDTLSELQSKQISDLLDKDDALVQLTRKQRTEEMIRATTKDEATYDSFSRELNRGDWTGPCL